MTAVKATPVLLVSDDEALAFPLRRMFQEEGLELVEANECALLWVELGRWRPHLVVLDHEWRGADSLELCEQIRRVSNVPIVVIGKEASVGEAVYAFSRGCDDYIARPFNLGEIVARIKAKLRRTPLYVVHHEIHAGENEKVAAIHIDYRKKQVHAGGRQVRLSAKEFRLLCVLAERPGEMIPTSVLYELVWRGDVDGDLRTVLVSICKLRRKLEPNPANPVYITSARGKGYCLQGGILKKGG